MKYTKAYLAGLGMIGLLIGFAVILLMLGSRSVAFEGPPDSHGAPSPLERIVIEDETAAVRGGRPPRVSQPLGASGGENGSPGRGAPDGGSGAPGGGGGGGAGGSPGGGTVGGVTDAVGGVKDTVGGAVGGATDGAGAAVEDATGVVGGALDGVAPDAGGPLR
jgi:hypothetical protein